jgi:hypothetical protein
MGREGGKELLLSKLRRGNASLLGAAFLIVIVVSFPNAYSATRPVINSVWASNAPSIDGKFSQGEWPDSPQIAFRVPPYNSTYLNATVYIMNDNSKLYVMVDATGDRTNDEGDENLIVLANTEISTLKATFTWVEFWGLGGKLCTQPGGVCYTPTGVIGAVGYASSPNSPTNHKMYETSIPLKLLNATAGQEIDFCSPRKPTGTSVPPVGGSSISYDDSTGRDNPWPDQLFFYVDVKTNHYHTDINTWGILVLAGNPVPEFSNSAALITSVLVLASLMLVSHDHRKRTGEADPSLTPAKKMRSSQRGFM